LVSRYGFGSLFSFALKPHPTIASGDELQLRFFFFFIDRQIEMCLRSIPLAHGWPFVKDEMKEAAKLQNRP